VGVIGYLSARLVNFGLTPIRAPASQVLDLFSSWISPLRTASHAGPLAFRLGQIDALAHALLASDTLYTPEMQDSLALRWLSRAWAQYREDRAITLGPQLIGAECTAQRNAFLTLLERALPAREKPLRRAIRRSRKMAIRPIGAEAKEADAIVAACAPVLDTVLDALARTKLPGDPLERLVALIDRFSYSSGDDGDALSATARTPCWAINLAATARGHAFHLSKSPLPFPGIVQRRLFRADRDADQRRAGASEALLDALHDTACDIARVPRAAAVFTREFPSQRSTSRLYPAWMLVFALGALTPAQLARALPATKAGAAILLRKLETRLLIRQQGPFEPFVCAISVPVALPDWRYEDPV
jgi:hypothetical protein